MREKFLRRKVLSTKSKGTLKETREDEQTDWVHLKLSVIFSTTDECDPTAKEK